jgi:hypothetical protein
LSPFFELVPHQLGKETTLIGQHEALHSGTVDQLRRLVAVNLALIGLALLFTETKGTRT